MGVEPRPLRGIDAEDPAKRRVCRFQKGDRERQGKAKGFDVSAQPNGKVQKAKGLRTEGRWRPGNGGTLALFKKLDRV